MTRAINNLGQNTPQLDSPPNILSDGITLLNVIDMQDQTQDISQKNQAADDIAALLFNSIIQELTQDIQTMIPRQQLSRGSETQVQHSIKFFEKKGIKTDLFAIEKYVEEILSEVMLNKEEFLNEIKQPLGKTPIQHLY